MYFRNREDAGKKLAERLLDYKNDPNSLILALPRGGVLVAVPIARELNLPLDLIIIRKIGVPNYPEVALGAVDAEGIYVLNPDTARFFDRATFEAERLKQIREAQLTKDILKGEQPYKDITGKTVILVDDGVATGTTSLAAIEIIKKRNPEKLVFAVPVCSSEALLKLNDEVDELIVDLVPSDFSAVSQFYYDFSPVNELVVRGLLKEVEEKIGNSEFTSL